MKSIILIYTQKNILYYVKKSITEKKHPIIYCSFKSVILDFNKPKAWIYIFHLVQQKQY